MNHECTNAHLGIRICTVLLAGAEIACDIIVRPRPCDGMYVPEDPMYTVQSRHESHPVARIRILCHTGQATTHTAGKLARTHIVHSFAQLDARTTGSLIIPRATDILRTNAAVAAITCTCAAICTFSFICAASGICSRQSLVISWRNACKHCEELYACSVHCCNARIQPVLEAAGSLNLWHIVVHRSVARGNSSHRPRNSK